MCSWEPNHLKLYYNPNVQWETNLQKHLMHPYTVKSLLQAWASIRIITVQGDEGGSLLEATSAIKVCSSNLSVRVAILRCLVL